jgi:putative endonuclease
MGTLQGFTKRYNINRLVHIEESNSIRSAIEREKQLKTWRCEKKVALIESGNPEWDDLAEYWYS